jgi:hypothetical protein
MFAVALLLIAIGLCVYLYARYRHLCEEDKGHVYVEDTRSPDWKFPPKWHPPTGRTKA